LNDSCHFTIKGNNFIEVPVFKAELEPALAWTKEGDYKVSESTDSQYVLEFLERFPQKRKEQIQSYLVPIEDWDKRGATLVGLRFSADDASFLEEKSRSLGYDWPSPAKLRDVSEEESLELPQWELNEFKLIADAMIGINVNLATDEQAWDSLTKGDFLRHDVCDAICCDRLDLKWDVDALCLLGKLKELLFSERATLTLALAEFWNRCGDDNAESVFQRLLKQFNGSN
jgi:hypothetical protein